MPATILASTALDGRAHGALLRFSAGAGRARDMRCGGSRIGGREHARSYMPSQALPSLTNGYFTTRNGNSRPRMSTRKP